MVALSAGAFVAPALASGAAISWSAPPGCPSEASLVHRVDALLDQAKWPADLHAEGHVTSAAKHYALNLAIAIGGVRATRTITSQSCETLAVTAAWLIAISIDPDLAMSSRAENERPSQGRRTRADGSSFPASQAVEADGSARTQTPEAPISQAPTEQELAQVQSEAENGNTRTPPRFSFWGRAAVFGGVWGASLPGPLGSLGARAGLGTGFFYFELRSAHMFAGSRRVPLGVVRVDLQQLGIAGCAQWGERLRGGPCLTLSGLRTHASIAGTSEALLEDAAQDAFVILHRRLTDLRPSASAKAFVFGIAQRVAHDYRRSAQRKGP
jgi:hypothetical protein